MLPVQGNSFKSNGMKYEGSWGTSVNLGEPGSLCSALPGIQFLPLSQDLAPLYKRKALSMPYGSCFCCRNIIHSNYIR